MTGRDHEDESGLVVDLGSGLTDAASAGVSLATAALASQGLSWSWDLDLEALVAAVSEPAPWCRRAEELPSDPAAADLAAAGTASACDPVAVDPVEAEFADYLEAVEAGQSQVMPLTVVAGRVAELVPAGPELAAWVAVDKVGDLEDGALAGMAASYRKLASWAQAGELAIVAELASRSAAADDRVGVDEQGRPARVLEDASAEVSLALTMSQCAASWWSDLGVTLRWRLAATGAALRAGIIDLGRARVIAEGTAALEEDKARAVEARVLPRAGAQTTAALRAAVRRAVIAADPQGADRRREQAERQAKVTLYPEADGTASLAGYNLPGVRATAAIARISTLARALKASGASGGIDLLRAQVFLGLLLGTLPYIPPPADAPPDGEPPGDEPSSGQDGGEPSGGEPSGDDAGGGGLGGRPVPTWPEIPAFLLAGPAAMGNLPPAGGGLLDLRLPWATLTGDSPEPGYLGRLGPVTPSQARHLADLAATDPAVRWRVIVTNRDGQAVAVTSVSVAGARRAAVRPQPGARGQPQPGWVSQVTVTLGPDDLTDSRSLTDPPPILGRVLAAAQRAASASAAEAAHQAAGGCAHAEATAAYRPTRRLWEYVTARDLTCRFRTCRRPAARCDLDHTTPFDQGGPTCSCNLGGICRFHHQVKGRPRWHLDQGAPGTFIWTTPTGRKYLVQPDSYAA